MINDSKQIGDTRSKLQMNLTNRRTSFQKCYLNLGPNTIAILGDLHCQISDQVITQQNNPIAFYPSLSRPGRHENLKQGKLLERNPCKSLNPLK